MEARGRRRPSRALDTWLLLTRVSLWQHGRVSLLDIPIAHLDGTSATLGEITDGRSALLVNVASRCGLTPQYTALEQVHERYADRGFTVVGIPCNQFGGQEPGTAEEIRAFCSTSYDVTFPMTEKIEVNGPGRHRVYDELVQVADNDGRAGDIAWNFEKFLIDANGKVVARFTPSVVPDDPQVTGAIERLL
jgi:glutathione peroxidase